MDILFLDFETRSTVDLRKTGVYRYAEDSTTEITCMGYCFDNLAPQIATTNTLPDKVRRHIKEGKRVVAHNANFELVLWNYIGHKRHGWLKLDPAQVVCTCALAYSMGLPGSLKGASSALNFEQQKDQGGYRLMLQLCKPRSIKDGKIIWWDDKEKLERLYSYCKQDVVVERELYKTLRKLSDQEQSVWTLDQEINNRGIQVDVKAVKSAIQIVEEEKKELDRAMKRLTKGMVSTCGCVGKLAQWVNYRGVACSSMSQPDIIKLLEQDLPLDVRTVLTLRQESAKSSTAKLEAMTNAVCSDGRIRGLFQYCGAGRTGRWAGRLVQVQNLPRPSILSKEQINKLLDRLGE